MCIRDDLGMEKWWDYMVKFKKDCLQLTTIFVPDCYKTVMREVGIEEQAIVDCI